ncbi:MAG: hypothetical protein PHX18_08660 [Candidatus Gastranaerophilales bacterium]|nr:hypothetical protein [Candidatus Gastranaerophilales bacterium]
MILSIDKSSNYKQSAFSIEMGSNTCGMCVVNNELESEFTDILRLREIVTKAIEPLRADKKIGSSLEAAVWIKTDNKDLLEKYKSELANIFIVSQVFIADAKPQDTLNEYNEENYNVFVTQALGEKCERCWKYRELGAVSDYKTICKECVEAIK